MPLSKLLIADSAGEVFHDALQLAQGLRLLTDNLFLSLRPESEVQASWAWTERWPVMFGVARDDATAKPRLQETLTAGVTCGDATFCWYLPVPSFRGRRTDAPHGAPLHVRPAVTCFLKAKFGCRVISRKSERHWPPHSMALTCLDFSFWPQAQEQAIRQKPLSQLKSIAEDFAGSIGEEQLRPMPRHTRRLAELCCAERGGHFEHLL